MEKTFKSNFEKYLVETFKIERSAVAECGDFASIKNIEKGQILVRTGESSRNWFFVEKGLLRQYFIDKRGKEHILYFAPENWLVGDRNSAFFNRPTQYIVEAIEDTTIMVLDINFAVRLSERFNSAIVDSDLLLQRHILQLQKRISLLLGATAEERYMDFISTYPNMLQRVPQWMIASYLGITPESLSRVRRELAKKNFLID